MFVPHLRLSFVSLRKVLRSALGAVVCKVCQSSRTRRVGRVSCLIHVGTHRFDILFELSDFFGRASCVRSRGEARADHLRDALGVLTVADEVVLERSISISPFLV